MNSKNSKTFDPPRLELNVTDKIELRRKDIYIYIYIYIYIALSNLSVNYT